MAVELERVHRQFAVALGEAHGDRPLAQHPLDDNTGHRVEQLQKEPPFLFIEVQPVALGLDLWGVRFFGFLCACGHLLTRGIVKRVLIDRFDLRHTGAELLAG